MATNTTAGIGPDAFTTDKKRDDGQISPEIGIEGPDSYTLDHPEKDASEEINYHTLTWWYV